VLQRCLAKRRVFGQVTLRSRPWAGWSSAELPHQTAALLSYGVG
jgi:hypothetical protein